MPNSAKLPHGQMKARAAAVIAEAGLNGKSPAELKEKVIEKVSKVLHKPGRSMVNYWLRQGTKEIKKAAEKAEFTRSRPSSKRARPAEQHQAAA